MPLSALIAATLVFSSLAAQAEDLAGKRLHLADGRILEGRYDEATGQMRLAGPGDAVIAVAQAEIASSENIVLVQPTPNTDDKATRKLKGERSGIIVVLRQLEARLGPHPEAELDTWGARLAEVPKRIASGEARLDTLCDARDEYRRQIALKETTTATTAASDSTTIARARERVVGVADPVMQAGMDATYRVAVDTIERRSVVAVAVEEVTLDAARAELARLDAQVEDVRHALTELHAYADHLAARVVATSADRVLRDRYRARLLELDGLLGTRTLDQAVDSVQHEPAPH